MTNRCWVPGVDDSGFSLANLPYGVATVAGQHRLCVAVGDYVLDLAACAERGLLDTVTIDMAVWWAQSLNAFLAEPADQRRATRAAIREMLSDNGGTRRREVEACLISRAGLPMACPVRPGDFVDFYSSYHHAVRAAHVVRPGVELNPNWTSLPVAYHGRTGTIIGSGEPIIRPHGQFLTPEGPVFAPTRALDFELEMGFVIGLGSTRGHPIKAGQFSEYVFGLVLLNDWSARDIQRWETVPLGPFQGKSFATQLGAWVVPLDALEPFRRHNPNASEAIGHLRHEAPWSFDIALEVAIESSTMRAAGQPPTVISRSNTTDLYWDGAQQLAHMTANGASTRPGDLWGTGTVSGAADDSAGCLLERTSGGEPVLSLPDGSTRGWLKDGDRVLMRGRAATEGHPTIDFGELSGTVAPALGAILEE